jgi:hypothetical protein
VQKETLEDDVSLSRQYRGVPRLLFALSDNIVVYRDCCLPCHSQEWKEGGREQTVTR